MGTRGRPGTGIEPLKDSIRLRFTYNGKRYYETLDLKPTVANVKAAARTLAELKDQMRLGVFDYAKAFPNSKNVQSTVKSDLTVRDLTKQWLDSHTVEHSTRSTYKPYVNFWNKQFGDKRADEVTTLDIREAINAKAKSASAKTVNNALIVLRGVYQLALADEVVTRDPTAPIKNLKHQKPGPDPFTRDEMERILYHMMQTCPVEVTRWFAFAFLTGMRPSEQVELRRSDLKPELGIVRVARAKVMGKVKATKTHTERWVDLTPRALRAAEGDRASAFLFPHPTTGDQWTRNQLIDRLDAYWYPTLDALGIRRRVAYQTRHTYATLNLMAGVNPAYISRQMGHTNMQMLLTTYARWIDEADKGRERSKVEKALG